MATRQLLRSLDKTKASVVSTEATPRCFWETLFALFLLFSVLVPVQGKLGREVVANLNVVHYTSAALSWMVLNPPSPDNRGNRDMHIVKNRLGRLDTSHHHIDDLPNRRH